MILIRNSVSLPFLLIYDAILLKLSFKRSQVCFLDHIVCSVELSAGFPTGLGQLTFLQIWDSSLDMEHINPFGFFGYVFPYCSCNFKDILNRGRIDGFSSCHIWL